MLITFKHYPTIFERLVIMGWTQNEIKEEIEDAYTKVMHVFNTSDDENYFGIVNEIILDAFGFSVSYGELFEEYDNIKQQ